MRASFRAVTALATIVAMAGGQATAESRFYGQMDIYSLTAPDGWTPYTDRGYADVVYDAPGGQSQGGVFAGLKNAERSLGEEITLFIGYDSLQDRRAVTIDGIPCETASVLKDGYIRNTMLMCHFVVPFADGDATIEFFLGSASPAAQADWQAEIFWRVANSIAWGDAFAPAP
jgi:hypothetical protein